MSVFLFIIAFSILVVISVVGMIAIFLLTTAKDVEFKEISEKQKILYSAIISTICGVLFMAIADNAHPDNEINAIEVYRGNTELVINKQYKGDKLVECDTIVVLKKDKK